MDNDGWVDDRWVDRWWMGGMVNAMNCNCAKTLDCSEGVRKLGVKRS